MTTTLLHLHTLPAILIPLTSLLLTNLDFKSAHRYYSLVRFHYLTFHDEHRSSLEAPAPTQRKHTLDSIHLNGWLIIRPSSGVRVFDSLILEPADCPTSIRAFLFKKAHLGLPLRLNAEFSTGNQAYLDFPLGSFRESVPSTQRNGGCASRADGRPALPGVREEPLAPAPRPLCSWMYADDWL